MATPTDSDIKTRIITHMNHDHARELTHYLRAFSGLSAHAARSKPTLADVSLDQLTLTTATAGGGLETHTIPLSPPLANLGEMRTRLIEMDVTAREQLGGISDISMSGCYKAPRGFDAVVFFLVATYYMQWAALDWVAAAHAAATTGASGGDLDWATSAGNAVWLFWDAVFSALGAGGWAGYVMVVQAIVIPVLLIHIVEGIWFERSRLDKHDVVRFEASWWLWMMSVFFEGFPAFARFDRVVAEKKRVKEAKKH
ncbi:hypothetical protein CFO_g2085 [Ceratocystis platani]|uniref:DUF2470 domain-containing protein n=1 Tax=Ceratocystis fimbriata f. sp. platani TaxID=88771 RepID=A0A0F8B2I1_CERFI|nr:hypothetical protein CFO_g2085 [Ceratocystis platani]